MDKERPKTAYLVALGIITGDRQHVSRWIRVLAYCVDRVPFDRAGWIFQVVVSIGRFVSGASGGKFLTRTTIASLAAGIQIKYRHALDLKK